MIKNLALKNMQRFQRETDANFTTSPPEPAAALGGTAHKFK